MIALKPSARARKGSGSVVCGFGLLPNALSRSHTTEPDPMTRPLFATTDHMRRPLRLGPYGKTKPRRFAQPKDVFSGLPTAMPMPMQFE